MVKTKSLQAGSLVERSNGKSSHIWVKRVCAVEEGVIFRVKSVKWCEQNVFLDRRQAVSDLYIGVEPKSVICGSLVSIKLLNSYAILNELHDHKLRFHLMQGSEMNYFCLKQGQG